MKTIETAIRMFEARGQLVFDYEIADDSAYMSIIFEAYANYRLQKQPASQFFTAIRKRIEEISEQKDLSPQTRAALEVIKLAVDMDEGITHGNIDFVLMTPSRCIN